MDSYTKVGRVAFVYRGEYNPMGIKYNRYDVVLVPNKGLYHCLVNDWLSVEWNTLTPEDVCNDPKDDIKNGYKWALFLPSADAYHFIKDHLKGDDTINITFFDEESTPPVMPSDTDYHDIKLNINDNALKFTDGIVTVDTFSNKCDVNPGYELSNKSVIEVIKEMLCPYVLPTLKWIDTPDTIWAGFGGTATWSVEYTKGSNNKPNGWWDSDEQTQLSETSPQIITKTITVPQTAPLGVYETHTYSVKDSGDDIKYETVDLDAKSVTISQPCFYWYSTTDDSNITSIDTAYAKKDVYNTIIESGREITQAESGLLNWWYLVPAGETINGFVQIDGATPNSFIKVKTNISVKIINGTTECLTVMCDLWKSGKPLTACTKFTNICK